MRGRGSVVVCESGTEVTVCVYVERSDNGNNNYNNVQKLQVGVERRINEPADVSFERNQKRYVSSG